MLTSLQPYSFGAREYLRNLLVGKEAAFNITHTVDASTQRAAPGQVRRVFFPPAEPVQSLPREYANLDTVIRARIRQRLHCTRWTGSTSTGSRCTHHRQWVGEGPRWGRRRR